MNENQLLIKLIELEEQMQICMIQRDLNYSDNIQETIQNIEKFEIEINDVEKKLIEIEDKTDSSNAKFAIIEQFLKYIVEIEKKPNFLFLSKSQNMSKNIVFGLICKDIHYLVQDKVYGIHIPKYLIYTYDSEDAVDRNELIGFLKLEIDVVKSIESPNYVNLRQYFKEFRERMIEKFI